MKWKQLLLLGIAFALPFITGISACPERSTIDIQALWDRYYSVCSDKTNRNIVEVKNASGSVLYTEDKGCVLPAPPRSAGNSRSVHDYILAYGGLLINGYAKTEGIQAYRDIEINSARENRKLFESAFNAAGNKAGRDLITGDDKATISPNNSLNKEVPQ